jgi:hypothetical protein
MLKFTVDQFFERSRSAWIIGVGLFLLVAVYVLPWKLNEWKTDELAFHQTVMKTLEHTRSTEEQITAHSMLKALDLEQLKVGLSGSAQSQKSLFESGLSLQEERRLLEKQLEIMTTTLFINPALQRIFLMRAEQPLNSYLLSYIPIKAYGIAAPNLPATVRIISKERFAHPERGKSEQIDGTLQWVPPQVGTSVRSKALGEFVMFTNSALILHGSAVSESDHERFPHICLGLDRESARRLYRNSFIGTRITLSGIRMESVLTSTGTATGALPASNPL